MEKQFYENMLKQSPLDLGATETFWDARAIDFNKNQQKENSEMQEQMISILNNKNILSSATVLDVGGGSGRYAIPLAKHSKHVTISDISSNMLKLAEENAQKAKLSNIDYKKTEWSKEAILNNGWEKKFDFVFSSMCPATRNMEGIANMTLASKGYCMLNQFVSTTDSVSDYLSAKFSIEKKGHDPHNDRSFVQAIFNLLWLDGYNPEINYVTSCEEEKIKVEEAVNHYAKGYGKRANISEDYIREALKSLADGDEIKIKREKVVATILWKS